MSEPRQFVNPEVPGYVGFANLPNQVHRKSVKKGFEFTLMVVGESGLGKSTLVNSLFLTDLYPERQIPNAGDKIERTVKIEASTVEIEERGVKLRLTVVDTPGFADAIDNTESFKTVINYIDNQFEKYLGDESGLNRRNIVDNRVHCCFYFINSAGHGLKPLDVAFMKAIHHKVNIVPVIAKADTLTKTEVFKLKKKILDQVSQHGIQIYPLPDCDDDEDEDYKEQCKQLKEAVPFAVVGSSQVIEIRGRKVRGRMYPWGVVEVENPDHCDFIKLRTMLITHMQDLQEVTHEIHYENYRSEKLADGTGNKRISSNIPSVQSPAVDMHNNKYLAQYTSLTHTSFSHSSGLSSHNHVKKSKLTKKSLPSMFTFDGTLKPPKCQYYQLVYDVEDDEPFVNDNAEPAFRIDSPLQYSSAASQTIPPSTLKLRKTKLSHF